MTTAVAVCALCGGGLHAARCPQCGHRTEVGWSTPNWSQAAEAASGATAWGGLAIDAVVVLAATGVAALLAQVAQWATGFIVGFAVVAFVVSTSWLAHEYCTRGRAIGHRLLGARALVPSAGLPPGRLRELARVRLYSTAHHDPLSTPGAAIHPDGDPSGLVELRPPLPTVILPDGRTAPVGARTVIGRYPVPPEAGATTVAINDLSRSMSRAHVALEADAAGQVVAIDLNSANGTAVIVGNTTSKLKPQARVPVPVPCVLRCGSQVIQLIDVGATPTLRAESPGWTPAHVPSGWLP